MSRQVYHGSDEGEAIRFLWSLYDVGPGQAKIEANNHEYFLRLPAKMILPLLPADRRQGNNTVTLRFHRSSNETRVQAGPAVVDAVFERILMLWRAYSQMSSSADAPVDLPADAIEVVRHFRLERRSTEGKGVTANSTGDPKYREAVAKIAETARTELEAFPLQKYRLLHILSEDFGFAQDTQGVHNAVSEKDEEKAGQLSFTDLD